MKYIEPIRDIKELNPLCQVLLNLALREIKSKGVDPLIVETYRTQQRQLMLYAQGRTTPGNKVTWTLTSVHSLRNAVDIVPRRDGKAIWNANDAQTKIIIKVMEKYGFEAGANWDKNKDSSHFQIKGVDTNGTTYSESNNNEFVTRVIQMKLNEKLKINLAVDGQWGQKTTDAVNLFRKSKGYSSNGKLGKNALKVLMA